MDSARKNTIIASMVFVMGFISIFLITFLRHRTGDYNYPPLTSTVRLPALLVFSFLYLGYWLYIRSQNMDSNVKRFSSIEILGLGSIVGIFLCVIDPIFSIDLFEYIMRGRIYGIYHANPYIHAPREFAHDLFYGMSFWKDQPMLYGPVVVYPLSLIASIAKGSVFFSLFSVKFFLLICHLVLSFFIYKIGKEMGFKKPDLIAQMYLFNPFVLTMVLVDGHFDTIMIMFLVSSLFMLFRKRFYVACFFLGLSFLTKYLTLILIPFYLVYMYSNIEGKKKFLAQAGISFLITLLTVFIVYKPLWAGVQIFSTFKIVGTGFDSNTFPYIFYSLISTVIPNLSDITFRHISYGIFAVIYLSTLGFYIKTKDKKQGLLTSVLVLFSSYIIFSSFQLGAWYIVWIIPFILLSRIPLRFFLVGLISFSALISFWKRISFLLIGSIFVYAGTLIFKRRRHVQSA